MTPIQSVLITGANAGLGREAARQLALRDDISKIYLACRNQAKSEAAKTELQTETGRNIFEITLINVADPTSVRAAVRQMTSSVDAVVLNAGGTIGSNRNDLTPDGVTNMFAANMLGHVVLVDELLQRQLVTSTVLYAGSEATHGIPKMGIERPKMANYSVEEFTSIANGKKFSPKADPLEVYANIKLVGAHWMASMARQQPHIRFVTMSPGGTTGTNGMDELPFLKRLFFKHIGGRLMPLFAMMHSIDKGASRYVEGLLNPTFESDRFYASGPDYPTGPVVDQSSINPDLSNPAYQDNANQAVQQFA